MNALDAFHFLRPWWALSLLPTGFLLWQLWQRKSARHSWQQVCDTELLDALLENRTSPKHKLWWYGLMVIWFSAICALMGPTWSKVEVPVYRNQHATIILLDLSKSMDAQDIKPSRLNRAKLKILRLIREQQDIQLALIVFAQHAFVAVPLTDDSNTIAALIPSLETALMPSQGSRPDKAILAAMELMQQSQIFSGDIILVTDGAANPTAAIEAAKKSARAGYPVSVLAVGTKNGGPIPRDNSGFVQDTKGNLVISKPNFKDLGALAQAGDGVLEKISANDEDVFNLITSKVRQALSKKSGTEKLAHWQDTGYWLLLPMVGLIALGFRRGWLAGILIYLPIILIPNLFISEPAQAAMEDFWNNPDQRGFRAFSDGQYEDASTLFENSEWQAASLYRAQKFVEAADHLAQVKSTRSDYNRGNALAKAGQYQDAIAAYEQVLAQEPEHENALFNKSLVEKLLQQSQQSDNKDQSSSESGSGSEPESGSKSESDPDQDTKDSSANSPQQDSSNQSAQSPQDHQPANEQTQQDQQQSAKPQSTAGTNSESEPYRATEETESEAEQALQQWLRQVPDDPGGLLRRKFAVEQQKKQYQNSSQEQPW